MKISEYDRIKAIENHSKFIEERDKLFELYKKEINGTCSEKVKRVHKALCKKWGIKLVLYIANNNIPSLKICESEPIEQVSDEKWNRIHQSINSSKNLPYTVMDGSKLFVKLQIDLNMNEKILERNFTKKIKEWKALWGKNISKGRIKETMNDKWDIYKLHKEGLTNTQIARKLYGKKIKYNDAQLVPRIREVERAIKKTKEIISSLPI